MSPDYSIHTPENVDLHLELAGVANRVFAAMADGFFTFLLVTLVGLALWGLSVLVSISPYLSEKSQTAGCQIITMVGIALIFVIIFGYAMFFEWRWQGQTPGKKIAKIRVIDESGQPATFFGIFVRNLVKIIDLLPPLVLGIFFIVADKKERRLGDMAAGTLVIRERLTELTSIPIVTTTTPAEVESLDVGRVHPDEYEMLLSFLRRRDRLKLDARADLAFRLAEYFERKLCTGEPIEKRKMAELFLEKIYLAYQSRADR